MNTVSRRYVSDKPELFIPEFRLAPEGSIKQGSGEVIEVVSSVGTMWEDLSLGNVISQDDLQEGYKYHLIASIEYYENLIKLGVAPEQARFVLPQGVMTEWVWSGSLQAWARFYNQRSDSHAQQEIQYLAHEVDKIVGALFPVSWDALTASTVA